MIVSGYECYVVARRDDCETPDNIYTSKEEAEVGLEKVLKEMESLRVQYPKGSFDYSVMTLDSYFYQAKSIATSDALYPENEW